MASINITVADIKYIVGSKAPLAAEMVPIINAYSDQFKVNTVRRMAAFLGQLAVESLFKFRGEIWGPTRAQLRYEGWVKDLGNTQRGDGSKFRGYGGIQITGRANVENFQKWCVDMQIPHPDFVANPKVLGEAPWWVLAAFWFWQRNNLNSLADKITAENLSDENERSSVRPITKRVNGGYNHLAERVVATIRAYNRLHPAIDAPKVTTPILTAPVANKASVTSPKKDLPMLDSLPGAPLDDILPMSKPTTLSEKILPLGLSPTFKAAKGYPVDPTVKTVQEILFTKGYKMVGKNDGKYGQNTLDGVIAARRDLGLPLIEDANDTGLIEPGEAITPDFLAAITVAPKREVDPVRAALPTLDIAKIVPEVAGARLGKLTSGAGILAGGVPAIGGFVWNQIQGFPEIRAQLDPILSALSLNIPNWAWFALMTGMMAATWYLTRKSERAGVQAYRIGERVAQD